MSDSNDHKWEQDAAPGYGRVNGRLWRCTDPAIPPSLRQELVNALMLGRREVAAGKRTDDPERIANARRRVHSAKLALGERGPKWWLTLSEDDLLHRMKGTLVALLGIRGEGKTVCPSEIARATRGDDWRPLLPLVRKLAYQLADREQLRVTQKGITVTRPERGPIRMAQGDKFHDIDLRS